MDYIRAAVWQNVLSQTIDSFYVDSNNVSIQIFNCFARFFCCFEEEIWYFFLCSPNQCFWEFGNSLDNGWLRLIPSLGWLIISTSSSNHQSSIIGSAISPMKRSRSDRSWLLIFLTIIIHHLRRLPFLITSRRLCHVRCCGNLIYRISFCANNANTKM